MTTSPRMVIDDEDTVTIEWAHVAGATGYALYTPVPKYRHLTGWRRLWARLRRRPTILPDGVTQHLLGTIAVEGPEPNSTYRFHAPWVEQVDPPSAAT